MDNKNKESDPWEMLKDNQEFSYWKEVKIGTEVKRIFARNPLELNYLEKAILKGENPLRLYEIYKIYLDRKEEFPFVNDYLGCINPFTHQKIHNKSDYDDYLWEFAFRNYHEEEQLKSKQQETEIEKKPAAENGNKTKENKSKKKSKYVFLLLVILFIGIGLAYNQYQVLLEKFEQEKADAYNLGLTDGKEEGREEGYSNGYKDGYDVGYDEGYDSGYDDGYDVGYDDGYNTGYDDGYNTDRESIGSDSTESTSSSSSSSSYFSIPTITATVYITNTGNKYHRWGCQYLQQSWYAISLIDARARGYTECSICW